jgi:hypothetical protein
MTTRLASITHEILEDHRRLRRALTALDAAIRRPEGLAEKRGVVAGRVVELRHRLADHFAAEEKGGFFERIQQAVPESAAACAELRRQHVAILTGLDRARDELPPASAEVATIESWVASVQAVLAEVGSHEERETTLLFAALEGAGGAPE